MLLCAYECAHVPVPTEHCLPNESPSYFLRSVHSLNLGLTYWTKLTGSRDQSVSGFLVLGLHLQRDFM